MTPTCPSSVEKYPYSLMLSPPYFMLWMLLFTMEWCFGGWSKKISFGLIRLSRLLAADFRFSLSDEL